ncbi:hypothetical protein YC2023_077215 [Brassica napus]
MTDAAVTFVAYPHQYDMTDAIRIRVLAGVLRSTHFPLYGLDFTKPELSSGFPTHTLSPPLLRRVSAPSFYHAYRNIGGYPHLFGLTLFTLSDLDSTNRIYAPPPLLHARFRPSLTSRYPSREGDFLSHNLRRALVFYHRIEDLNHPYPFIGLLLS